MRKLPTSPLKRCLDMHSVGCRQRERPLKTSIMAVSTNPISLEITYGL